MNFIHIITTRFNVPTKIWTVTREGTKPLSDEWMNDRFEIFRKYCLLSFQNQSNKNFTWLVFFDVNTPEIYLSEIEKIKQDFPTFHPFFVEDFEAMTKKSLEIIPSFFSEDTKFLISTDIDNDDLLHQDFVATVQDNFQPKHNFVIDLKKGLQLTKTSEKKAFINVFYMVANPFISLVENKSSFGTVMKEKHLAYRDYPLYTSYDTEPRFIQFIHANNLVNNTFSNSKRIGKINFSEYGIAEENYFQISSSAAFFFNLKKKIKLLGNLIIKNKNGKP